MNASDERTQLCEILTESLTAGDEDDILDYNSDSHIKEMLEYLDGMVADVQQIHKQIDEQVEMLKRLETRIDNVNMRVDHIVDGK